jgi:hypothetical protein
VRPVVSRTASRQRRSRRTFGTYFEAFMLVGLLCIAAPLMVLFISTGRRGVAELATAKAFS